MDICRQAGIANGNFTYYFKKKNELLQEVIRQMLSKCNEKTKQLLPDDATLLQKACLTSHMYMFSLCCDPQATRFVNEIYEDIDSRYLIPLFVEQYYNYFIDSNHIKMGKINERQAHAIFAADSHARLGLFRDLLEETEYRPTAEDILETAETMFLFTSRLCSVEEELIASTLSYTREVLTAHNFQVIPLLD